MYLSPDEGSTAANATEEPVDVAHVDLAALGRAAEQRGSGILYGLTEDGSNPPDEFLTGIGFRFQRAGGAQLDSPGGWVAGTYERRWASTLAQCRRTTALGGTFIMLVHDLYGADGTTIDRWPGDDGDWAGFEGFLDRLVSDVAAARVHPQWDLWNEPDLDMFWARSPQQYLDAWRLAYRRVRAAFPDAMVVGPSTAREPSQGDAWWNGFLDFVAANDVVPDVISWHEIGGEAHGQDPVASRAAVAAMLARRGLHPAAFQVNEYAEASQQQPGKSAWFLARLERAGIDGLRANWGSGAGLHDTLAGLLTRLGSGYKPLGEWFTYRCYASQQGRIATSRPGSAVDIFATLAEDHSEARLLLGNHAELTGAVAVDVAGLGAAIDMDTARVRVERIPHNDGLPIDGPIPTVDARVAVHDRERLTVTVNYANPHDAFFITLRLAGT
jgi:hypothetical protein